MDSMDRVAWFPNSLTEFVKQSSPGPSFDASQNAVNIAINVTHAYLIWFTSCFPTAPLVGALSLYLGVWYLTCRRLRELLLMPLSEVCANGTMSWSVTGYSCWQLVMANWIEGLICRNLARMNDFPSEDDQSTCHFIHKCPGELLTLFDFSY